MLGALMVDNLVSLKVATKASKTAGCWVDPTVAPRAAMRASRWAELTADPKAVRRE